MPANACTALRSQLRSVEADAPHAMPGRGHGDDAPGDVVEQEVGQGEVAEVVGAELQLEASAVRVNGGAMTPAL